MMKKLFTPARIGNCEIPNRLIVPAMVMNLCTEDGMITERYIRYIEEKVSLLCITIDIALKCSRTVKINIYSEKFAKPFGREHLTVNYYLASSRNLVYNTRD